MTTPTPAQADEKARENLIAWMSMNAPYHHMMTFKAIMDAALRPEGEAVAWPISTDDQVEALARECEWDNRKYMTPADYAIWCARMRKFARLAASPPAPAGVKDELVSLKMAAKNWEGLWEIRRDGELAALSALAEVLAFVEDANTGNQAVAAWHRKHADVIAQAAKAHDRGHMLSLLPPSPEAQNDCAACGGSGRVEIAVDDDVNCDVCKGTGDEPTTEAQVAAPAEALPSQTSGAGEAERKPLKMLVSREQMRSMIEQSPDEECEAGVLHPEALAKPASEPAGGGVPRDENNPKVILDGIAEALESAGYAHMANKEGIASILAELAALSSPASSSPAGAEALPAGVEAFVTTETQPHHTHPVGTLVYRYKGHDYGCSNEDTRRLNREYRAYTINEDGSGPFFTHPVSGLSPAPAQAGSGDARSNGSAPAGEGRDDG